MGRRVCGVTYLVASAVQCELTAIRQASPEVWRQVRRYNLPVQLSLAAAAEVIQSASDPARMAIFSLAPCQQGSADLYSWGSAIKAGMAQGNLGTMRMNPVQTLHAIDNLAMSSLAIKHGNHAYCLGLGGAAGQAWAALEAVQERFMEGQEAEALLMGGDQDSVKEGTAGLGVALLFSASPKPYPPCGRFLRLVSVERERKPHTQSVRPHAAEGLSSLLSAIAAHKGGPLSYAVPLEHSDGVEAVTVVMESMG
jgi:hypothetical protein